MHGKIIDGILHKQEKEKDRMRMGGWSWTINLDEIANKNIVGFCYHTEIATYEISKEDAEKVGFKVPCKTDGKVENKLVVPIKYWKVTKNGRT